MPDFVEIELKLSFMDNRIWERISQEPLIKKAVIQGTQRLAFLETIYFDSHSFALKKEGLSYRIRRQEQEWIATVKADGMSCGGLHHRSEWSVVVDSTKPDITPFFQLPVGERIREVLGEEPLQEMFRTRFTRKSMDLRMKDCGIVELALDLGEINSETNKCEIKELELELKRGNTAELLKLAAGLAEKYPLLPEARSKYYRGLLLIGLEPSRGETAVIKPETNPLNKAGQALGRLMCACVQELINAQTEFLNNSKSSKAFNQFENRKGYLKAMITFCRPLMRSSDYDTWDRVLNGLERDTLELRRINKLLKIYRKLVKKAERKNMEVFLGNIQQGEQKALAEKMIGGKFVPPLLKFWAWLLMDPFIEQAELITISEFTEKRFLSWMNELINEQTPLNYNRLRIGVLQTLYVLEQLKDVPAGDYASLIRQLNSTRDCLDNFSDIYTSLRFLNKLINKGMPAGLHCDAGRFAGLLSRDISVSQRIAVKAWNEFRDKITAGTFCLEKEGLE